VRPQKLVPVLVLLLAGPAFADVSLKGSGSSLSAPLYMKWLEAYGQAHPDIRLRYEAKNSTAGADQWSGRGADFASVDRPLNASQEKKTLGRGVLCLPVAIEGVAITYNLPGVPSGLKLSPNALSGLFMGRIKKWNDPAIQEENPRVPLPDMDVLVLHREEESALQDLFPSYLAELDPKWTLKREKDKKLHWPTGQNIKGNGKVLEKMRLFPGVIAAVDLSFAVENHLPAAELRNASGRYVAPTEGTLRAAASDFPRLPEDLQVDLESSKARAAYPLCTLSWLLVYQDQFKASHDHKRGAALSDFLNWVLSDGQKMASRLSFGPLPEAYLSQAREKLGTLRY
jgi:phosphate transport system substrate-binding protein